MENKCSFSPLNKESETISMLRVVETVTITVLESLLSSIAGAGQQHNQNQKRVASEDAVVDLNEFEKVDDALYHLIGHKGSSVNLVHVDEVQNELEKLESSIRDLEEGTEFLSRRLIKTRVSLLNILSH